MMIPNSLRNGAARTIYTMSVGFAAAIVLVASGLAHWKNPYAFFHTVLQYEIVDGAVAALVAAVLPIVQIVLGCAIVMRVAAPTAMAVSGCLFLVLASVQFSVLLRGMNIPCGCFSIDSGGPNVSVMSVLLVSACGLLTLHAAVWPSLNIRKGVYS